LEPLKPETEALPEESVAESAEEIKEPSGRGTLPPEPVQPAFSETVDTSQEIISQFQAPSPDEQAAAGEPSIQPPTASMAGYIPPWETSPTAGETPESGASQPVDIEASQARNVENTIPLTIEDLTAVADHPSREKTPAPFGLDVEPSGNGPFGWKLLSMGLFVALLISLYFNWRSYASTTDQPTASEEAALDTEKTGAAPGDPTTSAEDSPQADVQGTTDKNVASASQDAPIKKKKRASRSRSKRRSKKTQATTSAQLSSAKTAGPRPSRTTGVLSILLPSQARGPVAITVDKRPKGNAPLKLSLTPGLHEVIQTYKRTRTKRIVLIEQGKTKVITAKVPK
jgi:hypothetical protein